MTVTLRCFVCIFNYLSLAYLPARMNSGPFWGRFRLWGKLVAALAVGHEVVVEFEGGQIADGGVLAIAVPGQRGLRGALEGAYRGGVGGLASVFEGAVAEGEIVAFIGHEDTGRCVQGDHVAVLGEVFLETAAFEAHHMPRIAFVAVVQIEVPAAGGEVEPAVAVTVMLRGVEDIEARYAVTESAGVYIERLEGFDPAGGYLAVVQADALGRYMKEPRLRGAQREVAQVRLAEELETYGGRLIGVAVSALEVGEMQIAFEAGRRDD